MTNFQKLALVSILIITICTSSSAQMRKDIRANTKLNFGLNFGRALIGVPSEEGFGIGVNKAQLGFRLGADYDVYDINDKLFLETGLTATLRRSKIETINTKFTSLNIGTHLILNLEVSEKLVVGSGPYINFGLFGNRKTPGFPTVKHYSSNQQNGDGQFKRLDLGLDFKADYLIGLAWIDYVYVSYRAGITNLDKTPATAEIITGTILTRQISFGIRTSINKLFASE